MIGQVEWMLILSRTALEVLTSCIDSPHRCSDHLLTPNPIGRTSKPDRVVQWGGCLSHNYSMLNLQLATGWWTWCLGLSPGRSFGSAEIWLAHFKQKAAFNSSLRGCLLSNPFVVDSFLDAYVKGIQQIWDAFHLRARLILCRKLADIAAIFQLV